MQGGEFPGFESGKENGKCKTIPKLWKTSSKCLLFQGVFYGMTLYSTRTISLVKMLQMECGSVLRSNLLFISFSSC